MPDHTARQRVRDLGRKLLASPTLPLLGWTKAVETIVASGPTTRWALYAGIVTLAWIYADSLQQTAGDAVDAAEDVVDEATEDN